MSDDTRLFEKLCLESFQSGLSWRTILNKRDEFRAAFDGFGRVRYLKNALTNTCVAFIENDGRDSVQDENR